MNDAGITPGSAHWLSQVEAASVVEGPDAVRWDAEADLVVVGCGGAGLAAALQGAESGLKVLALDRSGGGGSTAINGGII